MKYCKKCDTYKSLDNFYNSKQTKDGKRSYCKPCGNNESKQWHKANPDYSANEWLRRTYDINLEQYNQMFVDQNGLCAICGKPESISDSRLSVDHNKHTGQIRGLLCRTCNVGIGMLDHDIDILFGAIKYLVDQ